MAEAVPPLEPDDDEEEGQAFPSYEEFATDLLTAIDASGLSIEDIHHEVDPGTGERAFGCVIRLNPVDPPSRYYCDLSFSWDALMTYLATYGPGADCDIYHESEEELEACPHHNNMPSPVIEIEAEFVLGEGGYELADQTEINDWLEVARPMLDKAFDGEDKPSIHLGLASLGGVMLVEKFTAEHSWMVEFDPPPDFEGIAKTVKAMLKVIPQLADRLPI